MSDLEIGLFFVGGLAVLALTIWSMRIRDLEERGEPKVPLLFGIVFSLLFLIFAGRALSLLTMADDLRKLGAALAAGCFSASAILMLARAYSIGRAVR